ncbi:Outer membrane protein TolC [Chitinophaga sp. YR627]|uniref:TolC family protein n=1 Tax=Chitinophaga sp. YR627 TaxID=1881041 RepID=UPI0008E1EC06|nr:TolC family protein [Chitinophaga sp. YR627]SFM58220.1 Outer membrane protein TolC [Chitinophaga sp. YR627]
MRKVIIISLLSLAGLQSHAQEVSSDLKELINKSFTYFPRFSELEQSVKTEEERVSLAKANGLPNLTGSAGYRYSHPVSEMTIPINGQLSTFKIMPNSNYNTGVNASYILWDFGVVKANVESAKRAVQYAKDNIEYNKAQMAYQVAVIYYQIVYLQKAIAIQDSVLAFLKANKEDTEIKLKHGDALRYDVLSIQSTIDQENNARIDLENSLLKQYNLLQYSTGSATANGKEFDFTLAAENKQEALNVAQQHNPEYTLLKDRISQSEAGLDISKKAGLPSLSLNASTGFANGYMPDLNQFRYNYTGGVTLSVPIYQGARARRQRSLAQSQLKEANLGMQTLNNTVQNDIRQAYTDIESNQSRLVNAKEQVEEAKEAQKLAQSRYRNGTGTNLELTNASTNVQRAERSTLQYTYQLCLARLELARVLGTKYW